ncbi:hypothetical protein ABEB36_008709 [Hypothenemus hampei]|uniref:Uncharacterized protein n=1 Tax=Hypothenemus hampei TaxID=57062 RepID=A0ABD1END8_HYPHA
MVADDMQGYGTDMLLLEPHVALKVNITQDIAQIQPDLCSRVVENWTTQIRATVKSRGGHLNDKLPGRAVIVVNNASYHSRKTEIIPTTSSGKVNIQEWLSSKNIDARMDMVRTEL